VVTLQGFVQGKLDLLTVSLRKLKFASVTDFSLSKLPRESFIVWDLKTAREQKNVLWISVDNFPEAEKREKSNPRVADQWTLVGGRADDRSGIIVL